MQTHSKTAVATKLEPSDYVRAELRCPLCANVFFFQEPKQKHYLLARKDSDTCPYYSGPNPLYYMVRVCPKCHYSSYKDHFKALDQPQLMMRMRQELSVNTRRLAVDFDRQERTLFAALLSFQLAYQCYELRAYKANVMAGVALRAAWLCRYAGDVSREVQYLRQAAEHFEFVYTGGAGMLGDPKAAFLLGESLLRTGKPRESLSYLETAKDSTHLDRDLRDIAKERHFLALQCARFIKLLDKHPLGQLLGDEGLGLLGLGCELKMAAPGDVISQAGEPNAIMILVERGSLTVQAESGSAPRQAELQEGDTFDAAAMVNAAARSATLVAGGGAGGTMYYSINLPAVRTACRIVPGAIDRISNLT